MRQEYGNQFLSYLNNKSKERNTFLVVLLKGIIDGQTVTDLQPAQEWCYDTEQTYNTCYTARYRADGEGGIIIPLIRQFIKDVSLVGSIHKDKQQQINLQQKQSEVNINEENKSRNTVGSIRRSSGEDWKSFEEKLKQFMDKDISDVSLVDAFGSFLNDVLQTGQRLVIFCEVEEEPSLDMIGLDMKSVDALRKVLPERFILVLSGIKDEPGTDNKERWIRSISIDEDYFTLSPPENRSQKLLSDSDEGEDALNIIGEVNALADAIASNDMEPPLVLGILGGWGSGKSYVMNLLKQRLLAIRNKDIHKPTIRKYFPYVGHFYLVRFDAWTYAKSDLWASLMQEVLLALNDQIAYEQISVKSYSEDLNKLKKIEKLLGQRKEFETETANKYLNETPAKDKLKIGKTRSPKILTEKYLQFKGELFDKMFNKILTGEDNFDINVVEKLTDRDADTQEILGKLTNDILWSRLQGLNSRLQIKLKQEEKSLSKKKKELAKKEDELAAKADIVLSKENWKTFITTMTGSLAKSFQEKIETEQEKLDDEGIPFNKAIDSVKWWQKIVGGMSIKTFGAFLVFTLATTLVFILATDITSIWVKLSGIFGGIFGGGLEALGKANGWMKKRVEEFQVFNKQLMDQQKQRRETLISEKKSNKIYQDLVKEVAGMESKVKTYRRKVGLTAGHATLLDFIANRLQEGGYEERLGPLHQVQSDIRQLSEGLKREEICLSDGEVGRWVQLENLLFPRGTPRIVLLIDDLDRCPPARVVEVLEAAQLLVKTSLFVVVLAMDVRYVTKALEKAYEGVLDRQGDPSGLDYIEKIVQIPYRIRPISAEAMPGYLRSQMEVRLDVTIDTTEESIKPGDRPLSKITTPDVDIVRIDETIPPAVLEFDKRELELIQESALAVTIGPRATKRLVNVMKLIKIIWYRTGQDEISNDIKMTVIFFLTLSARYAEIMRRVLLEMECIVSKPGDTRNSLFLPALLEQIDKDWSVIEGRKTEWEFLVLASKNSALLPPYITLKTLGSHNIELIRSFSFVGEVDLPSDPTVHKLSLQQPEPLIIKQDKPVTKR